MTIMLIVFAFTLSQVKNFIGRKMNPAEDMDTEMDESNENIQATN